jgi:hypothetical protein
MTDWRNAASEEAQADLDRLAQVTIGFAESLLDEDGDFLPFPIVIRSNGDVTRVGTPPMPETADAEDVATRIVTLFRDRAASIRALAIGVNGRAPNRDLDAIEVRLEHHDGVSLTLLVPYRRDPLDDSFEYEAPIVREREGVIWA